MNSFAFDSSDFTASGRKLEPVPSGHVVAKDNGSGVGTHNAGEDCGICHTPSGKAGNYVFSIAGTLYEDRAARRVLAGGEIILEDIIGNVISMTSNEAGNFWTSASITNNPCTVASHGTTTNLLYTVDAGNTCIQNVPDSDSRTWQYKAWVKVGEHVRHMVTIAPVGGTGGMSSARMSCNMHHASLGNRGGLWGAGKATLRSYPGSGLSFKKHILPIFRNKCAPCHIPGETKTRLTTRAEYEGTVARVDYSGSLDLTSYDGSTVTVDGTTWAKRGVKDMTTSYASDPDSSPVLLKTKVQDTLSHPGGWFWSTSDADYGAIRKWISEGAQNN